MSQAPEQNRPPEDSAVDHFPSMLGFVAFTVGVGLVTFLLFPAAVYYSSITYGLIASVFIAVGYMIWRVLMHTDSRKAIGFGIAFILPVLFILTSYLFGTPGLVGLIVAESLVFWIAIRFLLR